MKSRKPFRELTVLTLVVMLFAAVAGCASQDANQTTPTPTPIPTPTPYEFTYKEDIWSDRQEECGQIIIDKFVQDISSTGYNLKQEIDDTGIVFTHSAIEQSEVGSNLVVRGIVRDAETDASNFVRLTYSLGDSLSDVGLLNRGDEVQNAKFFCDIADHLGDLKLAQAEINTQIDAFEFYENYGEDMKTQFYVSNEIFDMTVQVVNELTGSNFNRFSELEGTDRLINNRTITFVGECTSENINGELVGTLPVDVLTENSILFDNKSSFTNFVHITRYSSDTFQIQGALDADMDAETFVKRAARQVMDVTKINRQTNDITYGSIDTDDGMVVLDNGVKREGEEARVNFNLHDFGSSLPDDNIAIKEFSQFQLVVHSFY